MKIVDVNKKSRIMKIFSTVLSVLVFALVFFCGFFFKQFTMPDKLSTTNWVIDMIDKNYLLYDENTGEVRKFTAQDYANAIVSKLCDQYSKFYSKEEYSEIIETNNNNYYGIGLNFIKSDESLKIFDVSGNSPAEKAGIKKGGTVKALEYLGERKEVINFKSFSEVLSGIPAETEFKIFITYTAEEEFTLSKKVFKRNYVYYSDNETGLKFVSENAEPQACEDETLKKTVLAEDTAYILYKEFAYHSESQLKTALDFAVSRGKSKLVLDLRANPGGYLDVLTSVSAEFLGKNGEKKLTVAVSRDKNGANTFYYMDKNSYRDLKIVVLADYNTASASEALIGAMTYYGIISAETTVISEYNGIAKTYGKGIMQTTFPNIFTGEALKLTTAYLYWPDNTTCIHGTGIKVTGENAVAPSGDISVDNELLRAVEILAGM